MHSQAQNPFGPTPYERKKERASLIAKVVTFVMSMALVIPMLLIIGLIFVKGWSVISVDYLWENPRGGGIAGGIWGRTSRGRGRYFDAGGAHLLAAHQGGRAGQVEREAEHAHALEGQEGFESFCRHSGG